LTDGASVNSGETFFFAGGPTTLNAVSLNGGILKVCGDLTINNLNFNGGKLIIASTGSLNFTHSLLTLSVGNQDITNYGSLTINSGFNVNDSSDLVNLGVLTLSASTTESGPEAIVYNGPGGVINMLGLSANIGNEFVNYGTALFDNFTINAGGSICMGAGAIIETTTLNNNALNSVSVGSGQGCIAYSGTATMNQSLSTFSNLLICNRSGVPATANFGSATVINNCTSCQTALPVRLGLFAVSTVGTDVLLKWTTEYEENVKKFMIEKSNATGPFAPVGEVMALNNASSYSFTTRIDELSYFRLRIVDIDGRSAYSKVLAIRPGINPGDFSILTNPVTDGIARITVFSSSETNGEFVLHDIMGRLMKKFTAHLSKGTNFIKLPLNEVIPGAYTLQYHDSKTQMPAIKLIKLN
jgi:hypothetical protein